jgi:hypothetical protein
MVVAAVARQEKEDGEEKIWSALGAKTAEQRIDISL